MVRQGVERALSRHYGWKRREKRRVSRKLVVGSAAIAALGAWVLVVVSETDRPDIIVTKAVAAASDLPKPSPFSAAEPDAGLLASFEVTAPKLANTPAILPASFVTAKAQPVAPEPVPAAPEPADQPIRVAVIDIKVEPAPKPEVQIAAAPPRHTAPARFPAAMLGSWSPDRALCEDPQNTEFVPLKLSNTTARAGSGTCTFTHKKGEGRRWTTVAECTDGSEKWKSNVTLQMGKGSLTWTSERGTQTYIRCNAPTVARKPATRKTRTVAEPAADAAQQAATPVTTPEG